MNRNAIILAAGMSTRFVPLSLEMPKALIKVKGEVLIERLIMQLREAGVREIVVVIGYMKEQFYYLERKYGVVLIENTVYKTRNNHSSLYAAREYLGNTFICCGDTYFTENVFLEESDHSYYGSIYIGRKTTEEWYPTTNKEGKIESIQVGGEADWIMKEQVYLTQEFSEAYLPYLEEAYHDQDSKDKYWEEIYIEHMDKLDLYIRRFEEGIMEEFDSIEDLKAFDKEYKVSDESRIMRKLCRELECEENELEKISPVMENGEAIGFTFRYNGCSYTHLFETKYLKVQEK